MPKKLIQSGAEAKAMGKKGGKKSGEKRRQLKTFKEIFKTILNSDIDDPRKTNKKIQAAEAIALAQIIKAAKGDTFAATFVRDTIGEKPTEKIDGNMSLFPPKIVDDIGK